MYITFLKSTCQLKPDDTSSLLIFFQRQRGECIPGFTGSEDKELRGGEDEQRVIVKEVRLLQVS